MLLGLVQKSLTCDRVRSNPFSNPSTSNRACVWMFGEGFLKGDGFFLVFPLPPPPQRPSHTILKPEQRWIQIQQPSKFQQPNNSIATEHQERYNGRESLCHGGHPAVSLHTQRRHFPTTYAQLFFFTLQILRMSFCKFSEKMCPSLNPCLSLLNTGGRRGGRQLVLGAAPPDHPRPLPLVGVGSGASPEVCPPSGCSSRK